MSFFFLLLGTRPLHQGQAEAHAIHSGAPGGWLGAMVLLLATLVVAVAFVLCARYLLDPGETSPSHIKRRILE